MIDGDMYWTGTSILNSTDVVSKYVMFVLGKNKCMFVLFINSIKNCNVNKIVKVQICCS